MNPAELAAIRAWTARQDVTRREYRDVPATWGNRGPCRVCRIRTSYRRDGYCRRCRKDRR